MKTKIISFNYLLNSSTSSYRSWKGFWLASLLTSSRTSSLDFEFSWWPLSGTEGGLGGRSESSTKSLRSSSRTSLSRHNLQTVSPTSSKDLQYPNACPSSALLSSRVGQDSITECLLFMPLRLNVDLKLHSFHNCWGILSYDRWQRRSSTRFLSHLTDVMIDLNWNYLSWGDRLQPLLLSLMCPPMYYRPGRNASLSTCCKPCFDPYWDWGWESEHQYLPYI